MGDESWSSVIEVFSGVADLSKQEAPSDHPGHGMDRDNLRGLKVSEYILYPLGGLLHGSFAHELPNQVVCNHVGSNFIANVLCEPSDCSDVPSWGPPRQANLSRGC